MITYVIVTEVVKYKVPVRHKRDEPSDSLLEAAEELVTNNGKRDRWCIEVSDRSAEFE